VRTRLVERIFWEQNTKLAGAASSNGKALPLMPLKELEKEMILQTLVDVNNNRTRAAEKLGITVRTLRNKLKEYDLQDIQR